MSPACLPGRPAVAPCDERIARLTIRIVLAPSGPTGVSRSPRTEQIICALCTHGLATQEAEIIGRDLFNASKYSLDIEMTVRYEWRGTSQDAWPSVSGLAPPGQQRKVCVPHAAADLTSARPPGSATPTGADLKRLSVPAGCALARLNCIH